MSLFHAIDERTGAITALKKVTGYSVPASRCFCRFVPVAIVFAFLLQAITGLFLWAFFSPSSQTAWESVYYVQYHVPFGWLVRGIHHYSAQLLVGMLGIYILMMIAHGSYRKPREFVYWSAVVMFLFSLASCLTGDLLMWSLSGYFATIARVSFLQLLPQIGVPLYQLVVGGPDPQFGTLTLTRFTVLHITVFGGGFFAIMVLWKWFDIRSRALAAESKSHHCALACATGKQRPFWGMEALLCAFTCLIFLAAVLTLVMQHSLTDPQLAHRATTLPAQAYLGAELTSPADPGGSYDAARPEWSFRALYHLSKQPIFSKIGMIFAIFVIPGALAAFFFAIPIFGNFKLLHYPIVLVTLALFGAFCWFTYLSYWDDYKNPDHAPTFLASKAHAEILAKRAVELAGSPTGIPKSGALGLIHSDPFIQGPKLFEQHCVSCHNFEPFGGQAVNHDFAPIKSTEPSAPNLYGSGSIDWIKGFHDKNRIVSDDYFGKTTDFAKKGSMIGFATGRVFGGLLDKEGNFILNPSGLIQPLIAPDGGPAFDILESSLEELARDDNIEALVKSGEFISKLKEIVAEKCDDPVFLAESKIKLPQSVMVALNSVLLQLFDDPEYAALLEDEDNQATIFEDEDAATFLEETFLALLNGDGEPIPIDKQGYINELREGILIACDEAAQVLYEESQLDQIRPLVAGKYQGLVANAIADMDYLTCTECHAFYGNESKDLACDLRGYMSRPWLIGIISDPTAKAYYGKKNDRMPAYHPENGDALLRIEEVEMLADWMRSQWYRAPEIDNKDRFGKMTFLPEIKK